LRGKSRNYDITADALSASPTPILAEFQNGNISILKSVLNPQLGILLQTFSSFEKVIKTIRFLPDIFFPLSFETLAGDSLQKLKKAPHASCYLFLGLTVKTQSAGDISNAVMHHEK
jgi:hypothetical protein